MGTCEMLHTSCFSSDVYNVLVWYKRAPVERNRITCEKCDKIEKHNDVVRQILSLIAHVFFCTIYPRYSVVKMNGKKCIRFQSSSWLEKYFQMFVGWAWYSLILINLISFEPIICINFIKIVLVPSFVAKLKN